MKSLSRVRLNFIMVSADLVMYIRNYKLDKLAEEEAKHV